MSIAKTADNSTPIRTSTRAKGRTTVVVAQLFTALLLVVAGTWLIVLFESGFNGGGLLVALGAVEIALGLASLAAVAGLRSGGRPGWIMPLSVAGALFNLGAIALAAAATLMVQYPGGAVVLLILFNNVIIGELVVMYFMARPAD